MITIWNLHKSIQNESTKLYQDSNWNVKQKYLIFVVTYSSQRRDPASSRFEIYTKQTKMTQRSCFKPQIEIFSKNNSYFFAQALVAKTRSSLITVCNLHKAIQNDSTSLFQASDSNVYQKYLLLFGSHLSQGRHPG